MTNRAKKGWRPIGAGATERSCKGAATHNDRALGDRAAGLLMLTVAATVVASLLVVAPAQAQESEASRPEETPEVTGMEAGDGPPKASDGSVETSEGDRSIEVGDGCVLIEEEGGEDLAVGSCDDIDDAGGRSGGGDTADEPRPDDARATPQDTTERTITEETTSEETAPAGATDFGEPTAPEGTAPEETEPADGGGADAECPTASEGETFEATVERAVDGDTLELDEPVDGLSRVRLVGVDAPEMEGEGGEPEPYAEEAADFTASELEGEQVLLELDEEPTDPYGRLLAYVWRDQALPHEESAVAGGGPELFNLTLLEEGYATAMPVEPNIRYAGCFEGTERATREEGSGLQGAGGGQDDEQYEEVPGPESTGAESPTPLTDEPERSVAEETGAGGPAVEEAPSGSVTPPVTDDRTEQTSPEAARPTEQTTFEPPEETGEETAWGPRDQYEGLEERTVVEATTSETTPSVPEGGSAIEVESEPVAQPAPETPAASVPALPTRQTPQGPAAVLPETGGAAFLPLMLGLVSLAAGVLPLGLLRRGDGCRGTRPGER